MTSGRLIKSVGLLGATLLVLLVGACGSSEEAPVASKPAPKATAAPQATSTPAPTVDPEAKKYGGVLRYAFGSTPGRMEPILAKAVDKEFMQPIYGVLVRVSPEYAQEPQLAKSWEFTNGNTEIILNLADATFHDGTSFNAQAVKSALDAIKDPDNSSLSAGVLKPLKRIDIVDAKTIKLVLTKPDAVLFPNLGDVPGMIPSREAMRATSLDEFNLNPVGAGCFKFKELLSDSRMTLERWDKCFDPARPYLDGLTIRIINDPAVQLANFRAGDIDAFRLEADQVRLLEGAKNTNLQKADQPSFSYFAVHRNMEPTDDVRVRQAISHAIDREAMVAGILDGEGVPIYGPIVPAHGWAWDPTYKKYEYNVAKAKALLADAGLADGFTLGPTVWYGEQAALPRMNAYADMLSKVGIKLDLLMMKSRESSKGYQVNGKYAAYSSGLSGSTDIDRMLSNHFYSTARRNVGKTVTPGLDEVLDKARGTFDLAERAKWYKQAQDLIVENMLEIFVYAQKLSLATNDSVQGWEFFPEEGGQNYFEIWLDK